MLWVLRDESGRLHAACEWHLVNEQAQLCVDGKYVWLEQFELSQGASMSQCARMMIEDIASRVPWTVAVYWQRQDKRRPLILQFSRQRVLAYANREGVRV